MLARAQELSRQFADEEDIEVGWERIWSIEPILFDETLIGFCDEAIREVAATSHRLPSGPLHDAAEVSRAGVPTVMMFVQSLRGLSHTKLEDTREEHLELAVAALDRLASDDGDRHVRWRLVAATAPSRTTGGAASPRSVVRGSARTPLSGAARDTTPSHERTGDTAMALSFGVTVLPDPPASRLVELMKLGEDNGFEIGWTYDSHVLWQDSFPLLTLAAQATSR